MTVNEARKLIREHKSVSERLEAFRALGAVPLSAKGCPGLVGHTFERPDGLYIQVESGKRYMAGETVAMAVRVAKNKEELEKEKRSETGNRV